MSGKIFINYRRGDDPGNTGRLFDRLQEAFHPDQLFMDVDSIKPGLDFVKVLEEQVSQCDVVLVVIGHNWIDARDETGARRLDNPEDFVRIEIESALVQDKRVIPVLVGEGRMPRSHELPEPIRPLARRHAVRLTHERFRADTQGLVKALQEALDEADAHRRAQTEAPRQVAPTTAQAAPTAQAGGLGVTEQQDALPPPASSRAPRRLMLIGGALAVIASVVAVWIAALPTQEPVRPQAPAGRLTVSGPDVLMFTGAEGGPFTPNRSSLTLKAIGSGFHWSVDGIPQWLSVSPSQGDLAADAATEVTVALTTAAQPLTHGQHSGQLIFRNHSGNAIVPRSVHLFVQEHKEPLLSLARERALKPRDTFSECGNCPEMVVVLAGSFTMGSPRTEKGRDDSEAPQHQVTIAQPFAVSKYELTFEEWDACVADGGCNGYRPDQGWGRGRRPVINVSWNDAKVYLAWLAQKTGKTYRLLSEAEYEYAARAGTTTAYPWGNDIGKNNANCHDCGSQWDNRQTAPVGSFAANGFGLYDMVGNVWAWTEDCYRHSYYGAPTDGSAWTSGDCKDRVVRGGSWLNFPQNIRSAVRGTNFQGSNVGFRVGRTLLTP